MILDASAIIAILRDVPERAEFNRAIEIASRRRVSAVNYVEAAVVMDASWNPIASRKLDDFFSRRRVGDRAGDGTASVRSHID
jgi:ribonuclease VapC